MEFIWMGLVLLFLVIEIGTLGLVTIWFMCGGLAAFFIALAGGPMWLQIAAFVLISVLLLAFLRPFAYRYINSRTVKTNVEALSGRRAKVIERVDNLAGTGKAMLDGMEWSARAETEEDIFEPGQFGAVARVEGVKLILKKCGVPQEGREEYLQARDVVEL
ncbi:MAG: NfeD family protein [Lachnospiraceae bacterium]|nr:NfeD family protein [Lachnospiraceae bacterium]